ncbi:DUF1273 domain-containing protein [Paenibacillus sp. YYML68]|uniref:DUF1273 domain-containing protein n=1 Tax=Paenibacillus sp. YYML68 TaxID=2909250 RepID=UPI0024924D93|nr:DUF1273 domain-containing protein [Paenibacillus sp. YYML68]
MKRMLITGYKASELGIFSNKHPGVPIIKKAIRRRLEEALEEGLEWVIVSGQWGVELWAAQAVIELKADYPQLQLAVITPFLEQEENWSDDKKEQYQEVLRRADYTKSVTNSKYVGPWQFAEKNKFLLKHTDGLLIVYDEEKEGSPRYMLKQAEQQAAARHYVIRTITAFELEQAAEEEQQHDYGFE